jgi:hypothetical protein
MELNDYLKSNCRSWEYDADNYEDTLTLTSHLHQRYPQISFDELFQRASHWTGYEEIGLT